MNELEKDYAKFKKSEKKLPCMMLFDFIYMKYPE